MLYIGTSQNDKFVVFNGMLIFLWKQQNKSSKM